MRRRELAWSYFLLSLVKRQLGDTPGAGEAIRQAVAIAESQVQERAGDDASKRLLTEYQLAAASLLLRSQRTSEALDLAQQVAVRCDDDYRRNPSVPIAQTKLARSLVVCGDAHLASGDPIAAHRSYEKARALLESLTLPGAADVVELARAYASLSKCPAPGEPPANPEGESGGWAPVDRAVETLRRAVAAGCWDVNWIRTEAAFDGLRPRDDFQTLINDMVFPADPFAR